MLNIRKLQGKLYKVPKRTKPGKKLEFLIFIPCSVALSGFLGLIILQFKRKKGNLMGLSVRQSKENVLYLYFVPHVHLSALYLAFPVFGFDMERG